MEHELPREVPGRSAFSSRWRSFGEKPNGITIASVSHHAKEHGWVAPPVDVTALFDGLPPPAAGASGASGVGVKLVRASDVTVRPISWLWQ